MPSPNQRTPGKWRVEEFGNKWMLVDPANNAYFMIGVYVLNLDQARDKNGESYYSRSIKKYGDAGPSWAENQVARIKSWGFNGLGVYYSWYALGTANSNKVPFWGQVRPPYYAMNNTDHYAQAPIKDVILGTRSQSALFASAAKMHVWERRAELWGCDN